MSRGELDLTTVRPYGDHTGDGLMQLSFTLPVPYSPAARTAAAELVRKMGVDRPEVVHCQQLVAGYTYFVVHGHCAHTVDFSAIRADSVEDEHLVPDEIDRFAEEHLGRPIVVIGASTGTDTHSVGIDAMLSLKGFHGSPGLEAYRAFRTHNLGSQVPNRVLVAKAVELGADAVLVSQTVTQQGLHAQNLTELVNLVETQGLRDRVVLVCGGPRLSAELAKELGFDAGFGKGTHPHHLASYLVREMADRSLT